MAFLNIKQNNIDTLLLFINKAEELRNSRFINFYSKNPNKLHVKSQKLDDDEWIGRCSSPEPNEEYTKAFILSLRFLIQNNENCSLSNIVQNHLPTLKLDFPEKTQNISNLRNNLNQYLDSPPEMKINLTRGKKSREFATNRDIFEVFIYGHYAHSNFKKDKKEWYDFIHMHSDEGINILKRNTFRFVAISILLNVTNLILVIANNIRFILDNVLEIHIKKAHESLRKKNVDKAEDNYNNAVYIANRYKDKEFRASLYKELYNFFEDLGKNELAKQYLNRFEDVKDSIRYLSRNFWEDEYYKTKFGLPIEFEEILRKFTIIKPNFPLLVFPIERLDQVRRFEKIIIAKNFKLSELNDSYNLYYEVLMGYEENKSIWSHHNFKFKKNEEFICSFPFKDDEGILFISNSKNLFVETYLSWLEMKNLTENLSFEFGILQRYVDILIKIELEKEDYKSIHKELIQSRMKNTFNFSIEGHENVNYHWEGCKRLIDLLLKISTYPKLMKNINMEKKIQRIKERSIEPFIKKDFKGLAWISFSLTIILYTFLTTDENFLKMIKSTKLSKLLEECKKLEGKTITHVFLSGFFNFLDLYIKDI